MQSQDSLVMEKDFLVTVKKAMCFNILTKETYNKLYMSKETFYNGLKFTFNSKLIDPELKAYLDHRLIALHESGRITEFYKQFAYGLISKFNFIDVPVNESMKCMFPVKDKIDVLPLGLPLSAFNNCFKLFNVL